MLGGGEIMDFITDWVHGATLYPTATFLRANSALQSFDNPCLTCKLEFPLDVGSNQTPAFQFIVVTDLCSGYITSPSLGFNIQVECCS